MTNLTDLTTGQLRQIIAIKGKIEKLQGRLDFLVAGAATRGRRMSAAARARIAAGARARWARVKGKAPRKGGRRLSAAGRAAIVAAAKARWARVRGRRTDRRMSPGVRARLSEIARARWAKVKASGKKAL